MTPEYTNSTIRRLIAAQDDRRLWTNRLGIIGAIVIIIFAFMLAGAVDLRVQQAENADQDKLHLAMQRAAAARELERGYAKCPPRGPGLSEILVLVIRNESDLTPAVETCFRIAERPYLPRAAR